MLCYQVRKRSDDQSQENSEKVKAVSEYLKNIAYQRRKKLWGVHAVSSRCNKKKRAWFTGMFFPPQNGNYNSASSPKYITDALWTELQPNIPSVPRRNKSPDDRTALNGMLYVLSTECAWENLPAEFGTWKQVYTRYRRWKQLGAFNLIWSMCNNLYKV